MVFGFNSNRKGYGIRGVPGFNNSRKRGTISSGDWDGDGVRNSKDCEPLNWRKQGASHRKKKVIREMRKQGINSGYASPNAVNFIANDIGVELKSEEVVEISDNY